MPVNLSHLSDDDSLHLLGQLDIKTLVRVRQVRRTERLIIRARHNILILHTGLQKDVYVVSY